MFVCEHRQPQPAGGADVGPTLLIGIDGATFTVLDPYMEAGVMPFLGELIRARHARACCARSCRR